MRTTTPDSSDGHRVIDFSDRLRVVAMLGVVAIHCDLPTMWQESDIWYDQVGKFVDGLFLFVSGYLWQFRDGSARPLHYLGHRLRNLTFPYLVWACLTGLVLASWIIASPVKVFSLTDVTHAVFVTTAFWFIPQLLLALVVTSWLWRVTGQIASGILLASLSLAYGLNLHAGWHPINHTEAPLGFGVFVWLGFLVHAHEPQLRRLLVRVPPAAWGLALLLTYTASAVEGIRLQSEDTLRVANLVFTTVSIGAALAYCYRRNVHFREPARTRGRVYGIYLVHTSVAVLLAGALALAFPSHWQDSTLPWYASVGARLAVLAIVWPVTSLIVTFCQQHGMARLVGAPPRVRRRSPSPVARTPLVERG